MASLVDEGHPLIWPAVVDAPMASGRRTCWLIESAVGRLVALAVRRLVTPAVRRLVALAWRGLVALAGRGLIADG